MLGGGGEHGHLRAEGVCARARPTLLPQGSRAGTPCGTSAGGTLKRRHPLLREAAFVLASAILLLAVAVSIGRLIAPRSEADPQASPSLEKLLGSLMLKQLRVQKRIVAAPVAGDAFRTLLARLRTSGEPIPRDVRILVVASPAVNAVTLPGDIIVVYSGLLARMATAEEMAGVLAHELGHVIHHDPFKLLVRRLGLEALIALATGGRADLIVEHALPYLVDFHCSRKAEDRADRFAIRVLSRAGIDPDAFADALERIRSAEPSAGDILARYIDPHAGIAARIGAARDASRLLRVHARPIHLPWQRVIDAVK